MNKVSNFFILKIFIIIILGFSLISAINAEEFETDINDAFLSDDANEISQDIREDKPISNVSNGSFADLSKEINNTPEGDVLVLSKDYKYSNTDNSSNKGIIISKAITIDGSGHTIYGCLLSRIFNITANNVIIKNLTFVGGCAFGRYDNIPVGGGAIYWAGTNGYLEDCQFINNMASGIEDDPYEKAIEYYDEQSGLYYYSYNLRPVGARTNEGGAIVWFGENGTVSRCLFKENSLDYPNGGGAIFWRGNNGKVLDSEFYNNWAFVGSAIYWTGSNAYINSSIFINEGVSDDGIFWKANKGSIENSVLLSSNNRDVIYLYGGKISAEHNWWGQTLTNINLIQKSLKVKSFYILNLTANKNFVKKGEKFTIYGDLNLLKNASGIYKVPFNLSLDFRLPGGKKVRLVNGTFSYSFIAKNTGFINLTLDANKIIVKISPKTRFADNKNITAYYGSNVLYKIRVFDENGHLAKHQKIKFTINNKVKYIYTNANAYVYLKFKKVGKNIIKAAYKDIKAINTVNIKSTLITKNLTKKYNRLAIFPVKVLNSKGKAYSNRLVKVAFKGRYFKFKTNSKGYVFLIIPKKLKVGNHLIKISANGLVNTNIIKVKK